MTGDIHQIGEKDPGDRSREKRDKFVKLGQKRTINAIRAIRTIGKLGNKAHYEYEDSDVKKIISALNKEVEDLKMKMTSRGGQETIEFKL